MPAGFTFLFLVNWLYYKIVATVIRGIGLPLTLTIGTLTLIVTALFLLSWRQLRGRHCLICRTLIDLQLISYTSFISLWSKLLPIPSLHMILYTCVRPLSCQVFVMDRLIKKKICWCHLLPATLTTIGMYHHKTCGPWYRVDSYCTWSQNLNYLYAINARL